MEVVENRNQKTLKEIFEKFPKKGNIIITDNWA